MYGELLKVELMLDEWKPLSQHLVDLKMAIPLGQLPPGGIQPLEVAIDTSPPERSTGEIMVTSSGTISHAMPPPGTQVSQVGVGINIVF